MGADFATLVRPHLEAQLQPGEALQGVIAANQRTTLSGRLVALAVTDRRLLLQPVDRKAQPKGEAASISPEVLLSAVVDGAGGDWWTVPSAVLDASAIALTLGTTDGRTFKLMMMKGTGPFGGAGGGRAQQEGVRALIEWVRQNPPGSPRP